MNILGINAYHGNASAAIVCDGRLIAAVEEERFNRVKYAAGFPAQAIRYCLKEAGLALSDVDHVAVPRNPYARLGTKLFYALRMPSFARERVKVLAKFTDRKSTRLNSSHSQISYAVFCLKKKKKCIALSSCVYASVQTANS